MKTFKLRYTNCYLIQHDCGWLLIDTGYEWEWEEFLAGLSSNGVSLSEITHLLITHAHDDHAGLLNHITEKNPNITIILSNIAASYLPGGVHIVKSGSGYVTRRMRLLASFKALFDRKWTHSYPCFQVRNHDKLISGQTKLSALGINLDGNVIPTPGHTDDSISLVTEEGDCYCGDAAANFFNIAGTHNCVIYVGCLKEYYESWNSLLKTGVKRIYPAHGKPFPAALLIKEHGHHKQLYSSRHR